MTGAERGLPTAAPNAVSARGDGGATAGAARVPPSFVHDLNTCVGCHACVLACANENRLAPSVFWRQIVSFNPERRPGLPTFHLSLACNHCLDAPCLHHCPALAISRDPATGAVLIDDGSCIGCRYCSWVCPYDAPRFNEGLGVVQKCTLCVHRLREGLQPACASLCPTGALRVGEHADGPEPEVAGFPRLGIRPAIRFVALKGRRPIEPADAGLVAAAETAWGQLGGGTAAVPRKISLRSEWTLAVFTFVAIILVASMSAWTAGGPVPRAWVVAGVGLGAMMLSALHLGRKERAWRAMLNWRRSWLSREVLTYSVFLGLSLSSLVLASGPPILPFAAVAAGFACLTSVDRVYVAMARDGRARMDDIAATTSAVFLAGVFVANPWVFVPAGVARMLGAVLREVRRDGRRPRWTRPVVSGRIAIGLIAPAVLWIWGGAATWSWGIGFALLGEALDRLHFYDALDIVTPQRRMMRDLEAGVGPGPTMGPAASLAAATEL